MCLSQQLGGRGVADPTKQVFICRSRGSGYTQYTLISRVWGILIWWTEDCREQGRYGADSRDGKGPRVSKRDGFQLHGKNRVILERVVTVQSKYQDYVMHKTIEIRNSKRAENLSINKSLNII